MIDPWPLFTAVVGAATGVVGTFLAIRKDTREARAAFIEESKETIDLLKQQNQLLRDQVTAAEARERQWVEREQRLEGRINELEREYRNLVKTVASLGINLDAR